jgi:GNAT superfamily N-acetyltransferase
VKSVEVTTWFLEITDPGRLPPSPAALDGLEIRQAELPSPEFSRALYTAVGADWYWVDRFGWPWERWMAWLDRPELETWVAYVRGTPAGYFELERDDASVEIAAFGLLPAFIGRGIGARLLDFAIRRGWESGGVGRVWVHTCSLDGPAALRTYQGRGLEVYDERVETVVLPDDPPEPWPGAERPAA